MTRSMLSICFLIALLILPALSQKSRSEKNLERSFKSFSLTRLDPDSLSPKFGGERLAALNTNFGRFEMRLTPRELRAPSYRAEETTAAGSRAVERGPVTTFKGVINGEPDSRVRVSIDDGVMEGFFVVDGETYFVEPAARYSKMALEGDLVVYRQRDVLLDSSFVCQSELMNDIRDGKQMLESGSGAVMAANMIDIATEADHDFFLTNNSNSASTNNKILSILNMTEGLYEAELNLTIRVTFQHTYAISDGYDGSNAATLLESFRVRWNGLYPTEQYPRDTAHLFTYKPNVRAQGYAFLGVVCNNPSYAYGLSGRVDPTWGWEEANFLVTSHEIAHNLGANHSDSLPTCTNSLMQSALNGSTQLSFCTYSRGEVGNFVGSNGTCLTPARTAVPLYDYDGDGRTDQAIFRPSSGIWFIANSTGGFNIFQFGQSGDMPVGGDFDGDGKSDPTIYRNGVWWRFKSANNTVDAITFGLATDIPAPGDFDGDGTSDVVVFRPSNGVWHFLSSATGGYSASQFGINGDVPTANDYDGDGKTDISVFRPSNGVWYRINSGNQSFFAAGFGLTGDRPVAGDFDGDGKADLAVFRPSNGVWYAMRSSDSNLFAVSFGLSSDVPVVGDFDGDARSDVAVFRPSNGVWHRLLSSNGGYQSSQFGIGSDLPVQAR